MLIEKPGPYVIIFALWLLMFSASSQLMIIAPILPQIGAELNIPENIQGGFMSFALLLHSFAFDYYSLLIMRAMAGAAGGVLSGSCVAYVGDYFPYHKRGWANGWISTGIATGQIVGIPLGTVLAEWYGFNGPFALFAMSMYLAFMLIWLAVPQPDVRRFSGKLTLKGALLNYAKMLTQRHIAAAAGVYGLMYLGISLYVVYLPTWLKSTFGISGYEIASLFFAGGIATVLTGPRAGKLSDRTGRKKLILASCLGLSLVMAVTTFVIATFWLAYAVFFIVMVLVAARMSPFQALISEIVPDEKRGAMMSLTISLGQMGMGLGGAAAGIVYSGYGYLSSTLLGALSVLMMAILIWRFIPEPEFDTPTAIKSTLIHPETDS
jgi:predicted MFS family arabinose efflux permease